MNVGPRSGKTGWANGFRRLVPPATWGREPTMATQATFRRFVQGSQSDHALGEAAICICTVHFKINIVSRDLFFSIFNHLFPAQPNARNSALPSLVQE